MLMGVAWVSSLLHEGMFWEGWGPDNWFRALDPSGSSGLLSTGLDMFPLPFSGLRLHTPGANPLSVTKSLLRCPNPNRVWVTHLKRAFLTTPSLGAGLSGDGRRALSQMDPDMGLRRMPKAPPSIEGGAGTHTL